MKTRWTFDIIFIILLAIVLVLLNEARVISLSQYNYIYIALLTAYFIGRGITRLSDKSNSKTT